MSRTFVRPTGEQGAALLTVLLVIAAVTGLVATVAVAATQSVRSARSDIFATAALGQSEAGVAQAQQYLRTAGAARAVNGCGAVPSVPPASVTSTCTTPWGTSTGVSITTNTAAGQVYRVMIQAVTPFSPPTSREGVYRITSVGQSTSGGVRTVQVDVRLKPQPFPFGVYAQESISQGGGLSASNVSLFSGKCINKRQQINVSGVDAYYPKQAAAHAVGWITSSSNGCSKTDRQNIHRTAVGPCHTTYPHDQDSLGSDSPGSCPGHKLRVSGCNFTGGATSRFTQDDLACYSINSRGLPPQVYEDLKQVAMASGTFFTSPTYSLPASLPAEAVIYFDLRNNTNKAVSLSSISGYDVSQCGTKSVIVVVDNGNATLNANTSLVGSFFVPDGTLKFNGTATVIGTFFAKNLDMGAGNAQISLNSCYTQNPPGQLLTVTPISFSELDR